MYAVLSCWLMYIVWCADHRSISGVKEILWDPWTRGPFLPALLIPHLDLLFPILSWSGKFCAGRLQIPDIHTWVFLSISGLCWVPLIRLKGRKCWIGMLSKCVNFVLAVTVTVATKDWPKSQYFIGLQTLQRPCTKAVLSYEEKDRREKVC